MYSILYSTIIIANKVSYHMDGHQNEKNIEIHLELRLKTHECIISNLTFSDPVYFALRTEIVFLFWAPFIYIAIAPLHIHRYITTKTIVWCVLIVWPSEIDVGPATSHCSNAGKSPKTPKQGKSRVYTYWPYSKSVCYKIALLYFCLF